MKNLFINQYTDELRKFLYYVVKTYFLITINMELSLRAKFVLLQTDIMIQSNVPLCNHVNQFSFQSYRECELSKYQGCIIQTNF